MPYIYLAISVFMNASSSVFGKLFNKRAEDKKDATIFYNFLLMISVCVCWAILYAIDFSFEVGVLWYSGLFALCYTVCHVGLINALKYGPASLTSLLMGLSLLVTTIWGFIFWNAELTIYVITGLILVACSIALCLYSKKDKEQQTISWKWLFYVALAFFGNAGCTIVQRTQQIQYNGQHGNMLMLFATLFSALAYLIIYLKSDNTDSSFILKESCWAPIGAGLCNVVLNVFVMLLALTNLSPSLIYPVIGAGGLAVVTIFSLLVFKEKMRWWQWLGVGVGAVAVVLLSL